MQNNSLDFVPHAPESIALVSEHATAGLSDTLDNGRETALPLDFKPARYVKRTSDIVISGFTVVLVLWWMMPLIALMIKLSSPGPVFFLQKRHKRNGTLFTCIKFRTMLVNEEADWQPARKDDERITRFGRFLRNHYLDELPQFINVLMGHMSLVGPRPHMLADNERFARFIIDYPLRHRVKPGITGLAQVKGFTGIAETKDQLRKRLEMDLHYVNNWSFGMDMGILLRTLFRIIKP